MIVSNYAWGFSRLLYRERRRRGPAVRYSGMATCIYEVYRLTMSYDGGSNGSIKRSSIVHLTIFHSIPN